MTGHQSQPRERERRAGCSFRIRTHALPSASTHTLPSASAEVAPAAPAAGCPPGPHRCFSLLCIPRRTLAGLALSLEKLPPGKAGPSLPLGSSGILSTPTAIDQDRKAHRHPQGVVITETETQFARLMMVQCPAHSVRHPVGPPHPISIAEENFRHHGDRPQEPGVTPKWLSGLPRPGNITRPERPFLPDRRRLCLLRIKEPNVSPPQGL